MARNEAKGGLAHLRGCMVVLPDLAHRRVAALEAAAGARVDRAEFMVIRLRCAWSLAVFGAAMWLLADVGRWQQGGVASSVARQ